MKDNVKRINCLIKKSINGLGDFEFYEGYFVGHIYEGVNADSRFVDELSEHLQKYYEGRPIVYISDRLNSYSIDPADTQDLIDQNNIRYAGVVSYTAAQKRQYHYQKQVQKGIEFHSFHSIDSAIDWAKEKAADLTS